MLFFKNAFHRHTLSVAIIKTTPQHSQKNFLLHKFFCIDLNTLFHQTTQKKTNSILKKDQLKMNETLTIILCFTIPCLFSTLGAALIFLMHKESGILNTITLGLAAGIMLSASIWSLLVPAQQEAALSWGNLACVPLVAGFALGGLFMILLDFLSEKLFKKSKNSENARAFTLFSAITVHNIPEGLSVGFAVGTAISTQSEMLSALIFAIGIAIQNFPEGLATALPLNNCLNNRKKSFILAFISGIVEPLFALLGYFLASTLTSLLPWLLSFSAGAMIYVIIEEILPEMKENNTSKWGIWMFLIGFIAMMILDICLAQ